MNREIAGAQQIRVVSGTGNFQFWTASVNSSLSYEWRRSGVSASYVRGVTSGSGAVLGAVSSTFSGTARHPFTRLWTGVVTGGYALNSSLAPAGSPTTSFTDWFAGPNLGRQLGPRSSVNFNYGVQKQDGPALCPVASCGETGYVHTFGVTVNWHLRPLG